MIILNKTHLYIFHQQDKLRETQQTHVREMSTEIRSKVGSYLDSLGLDDLVVSGLMTEL
jgi:hypothetical protein